MRSGRKKEQRREALAVEDTFYSVSEHHIRLEAHKLRTANVRRQRLERLVYPEIGHRPVVEIRRSEVVRLLDKIEANNGPAMAQAVLAIIRRTLSWYSARSDDFANPLAGVRGLGRVNPAERARDRILNDVEIKKIWTAADGFAGPEGKFVQFLLATACRRSEAAGMRFEELSGSDWTLPAARNKVGKVLVRPLSALALKIIDTTPRISDEFVFSTGTRPLAAFSRFKRKLDEASGVTGWTLHDCRRSARSLLARAGVTSEVAERCLGHVLGGVEGTYNRHSYAVEMRRAYEMLSALIERIVNSAGGQGHRDEAGLMMRAPIEKDPWLNWSPPEGSIQQAVERIAPTPEQRAKCEERVIAAMWMLHLTEKAKTIVLSPAKYRDRFRKFAEALLAVEDTGRNLVPDLFMEEVRRQRETYEKLAAFPVPANSAKPRDTVKEIAVIAAHGLLTGFNGAPPGLTRQGAWHKLAAILSGKDADESSIWLHEGRAPPTARSNQFALG